MKSLRIAIIGAGAAGGITAAVLKKSGYDVNFVTKHPEVALKISDDIFSELYSKLIINACITTLGAVSGLLLGKMLMKRKTRVVSRELISLRNCFFYFFYMQIYFVNIDGFVFPGFLKKLQCFFVFALLI